MAHEFIAPERGELPARRTSNLTLRNGSITFAEAYQLYLAAGGEDRLTDECHQIFDGMSPSEITQEVLDYWGPILHADVELSTLIREYYGPLGAVLHFAHSIGLCPYLLIKRPRISKATRLRWRSPAQSMRLANACCPHFRPLYLFLQHTGASPAESVYLDWRQINLARREVSFPRSGSADERVMALHPRVLADFERLPYREGRVFRRPDRAGYTKSHRPANAFKTALAKAVSRAGITDFTYRDIRTTYCMWRLALDRDADLLFDLGGRDARMIQKYKHASTGELDALRTALRDLGWDSAPLIAAPVRR
jgi:integrase